jgi:CheY-like chemotaxis protein
MREAQPSMNSGRREWNMPHPTTARQRVHLLLIDDCVSERDLYECVLETEFSILTATRGADGLLLADRARPDAIVLDVLMPGMDGWETCTQIKGNPSTADIPVILLTAVDDHDVLQHAIAVGASAVLHKPCSGDRLRDAILAAVNDLTGRASQ